MACERYLTAINELLDGTLGPLRRAELELHLETCEACAALLADLREIRRATESLDDLPPPPRVWDQIADRLRQEGRVTDAARGWVSRPRPVLIGLAAALILAVGASLLMIVRSRDAAVPATSATAAPTPGSPTPPAESAGNAAADDSVQSVAPAVTMQLEATQKEFEKLLEEAKKAGAPPETLAVLQQELLVVTDALENSRKALEANPQNAAARDSFYDLLRQKIRFLQDTIALMNEMWQGDAAGAAQIVEGGKS
jgi:tetratricopeptide (TPR) repeat protein